MIAPALERRLLQGVILIAGLVPVYGGGWGALGHMATVGATSASEARYLSGLLLGIGLTFWACVPTIERRGAIVRGLAVIVVMGGLEPVENWDSRWGLGVIQALDGTIRFERRPVGEDGAALPGQGDGPWA